MGVRRQKRAAESGFSLVELMIVVAIIGILASTAIPNLLSSRRAANEASAISSLRVIHAAETMFAVTNGGQYGDLPALAQAGFINSQLGGDGTQVTTTKSGFSFSVIPTVVSGTPTFIASATPQVAGTTGTRRFGVDETGVIRYDATQARLSQPFAQNISGSTLQSQGIPLQ